MLKFDSWPPEAGKVHLTETSIATFESFTREATDRVAGGEVKTHAFERLGDLGAYIGDFLVSNVADETDRRTICRELVAELPQTHHLMVAEVRGMAMLVISTSP